MSTSVSKKGQTVIPAAIRRRYNINSETRLAWIDTGDSIRIIPIPKDPIAALRGSARGENLLQALLESREEDKRLERLEG